MYPSFFFFNDTATTEIYTLSLHDALPISFVKGLLSRKLTFTLCAFGATTRNLTRPSELTIGYCLSCWLENRSEEHTSELQSLRHLVCRLLLEPKKKVQAPVSLSLDARATY